MCRIFKKVPFSTFFYILVIFSPKQPLMGAFLLIKTPKTYKTDFGQKNGNLCQKYMCNMSLEKFK